MANNSVMHADTLAEIIDFQGDKGIHMKERNLPSKPRFSMNRVGKAAMSCLLAASMALPTLLMPEYGFAQDEGRTESVGSAESASNDESADVARLSSAPKVSALAEGAQQASTTETTTAVETAAETADASTTTEGAATQQSVRSATSGISAPDYSSVLSNCSVTLSNDGQLTPDASSINARVSLDASVPSCYLTIFAYASNTSFDPDASQNIRLWSGRVTDGFDQACRLASNGRLKAGYSIIGCLNVPVNDDIYRNVNSAPIPIVDEDGGSFVDYEYPDASIDEKSIDADAASLHVSLTGDERLFEAAKKGEISITVSVAQYPADDDFDFESEDQMQLCSPINATEAFSGREVTLSAPLKEGYRVRAVVYWSQNTDLFLVKGNDYESKFYRPDDSLVVAESSVAQAFIIGALTAKSDTIDIELKGAIPAGSVALVKSYPATATSFPTNGGTLVASKFLDTNLKNLSVDCAGKLVAGEQVVVHILCAGELVASSEPSIVANFNPYTVTLNSLVTAGSDELKVNIATTDPAYASKKVNIVRYAPVLSDGTIDAKNFSNPVSYMNDLGEVVLDMSKVSLQEGAAFHIYLYVDGEEFLSDEFRVAAAMADDEVLIEGTSVTPQTTSVTVHVSGCADFIGGRLFITRGTFATDDDADSRAQMASVVFTGAGTYTLNIDPSKLSAGQTVLAHLYKYDADADTTKYFYGNSLPFATSVLPVLKEASTEIATSAITADRTDVWVKTDFDSSLSGTLSLYCVPLSEIADALPGSGVNVSADILSGIDPICVKPVNSSEYSQKATFASGSLVAGCALVAQLSLSNGDVVTSPAAEINAAPEKQKPYARIINDKVSAGMTGVTASLSFDPSISQATYKLFRFAEGEEIDANNSVALASGTIYRTTYSQSIYIGPGKMSAGDRLVIELEAGGVKTLSEPVEVQPSPDWGEPYVVFAQAAAAPSDRSVSVSIDYADEYLEMGDDFYCDVSVYQVPAWYTDEQIEDNEIWENMAVCKRVAQNNSNFNEITRGQFELSILDGVELEPESRLFIKLRLPHVEWEGEEVDYLSAGIPVLREGESLPTTKVLLYNLGSDTSRGAHNRAILADMEIDAETVDAADLDQHIGYLAGLDGYDKVEGVSGGSVPSSEFMLMCGFGEALLDGFLDRMQAESIRIDHKAIVTEYNREYTLRDLIGDIASEHEIFQALLELDKLIAECETLVAEPPVNVSLEDVDMLKEAIVAGEAVLSSYEPELGDLQQAIDALKAARDKVLGEEPVQPSEPVVPVEPVAPGESGGSGSAGAAGVGLGASSALRAPSLVAVFGSSDSDSIVENGGEAVETPIANGLNGFTSAGASNVGASEVADDETPMASLVDENTDRSLYLYGAVAIIAFAGAFVIALAVRKRRERGERTSV